MAFTQLIYSESLRASECYLRVIEERLYHAGIRGKNSRNTLSDANENRNRRIYAEFAQHLIRQASASDADVSFGLQLKETVYAVDSTTIDLCLSLFRWACFRTPKAGIKPNLNYHIDNADRVKNDYQMQAIPASCFHAVE